MKKFLTHNNEEQLEAISDHSKNPTVMSKKEIQHLN
jgi:hypothetical protein